MADEANLPSKDKIKDILMTHMGSFPKDVELLNPPVPGKAFTGTTHLNYAANVNDRDVIVRVASDTAVRKDDFYFGGKTDLEKQAHTIGLLKYVVPGMVPEVLGQGDNYLIVGRIAGRRAIDVFRERGSKLEDICSIAAQLGQIFSKIHGIKLSKFGSVQPEGIVDGKETYKERFLDFINRHFEDPKIKNVLNDGDLDAIKDYVDANLDVLEYDGQPSLVVYDAHLGNFNVDDELKITGLFDLEMAQAAHPGLECGTFDWNVFGLLGNENAEQIRNAFMTVYHANKGPYQGSTRLDNLHAINHMLSAASAYQDSDDPVKRAEWPGIFAERAMTIVKTGEMDLTRFY